MKNQQEIERMAEQTLSSLDNLQQVEANEYLHSKIWLRINDTSKSIPPAYNRLMLRLAAVLFLFIGINCVSFYALKQHSVDTAQKSSGADAFANAYNLNDNSDSY